jgi:protein-S-isoprenylcysteine O-methyltransferase Ste14
MQRRRETLQERAQRDDLTGEHRLGDTGQLVFFVLFLAVWLVDTFALRATTWLNQYGSSLMRTVVGFALMGLSLYLASVGMKAVFGERRAEPGVIRTGLFGLVRHPIYLSEMALYVGFLVHSTSLAAAGVALGAFVFLNYIARHEERLLLARFGDDYARYKREVGMWLPRLGRRR